jgi:hypothetical protein
LKNNSEDYQFRCTETNVSLLLNTAIVGSYAVTARKILLSLTCGHRVLIPEAPDHEWIFRHNIVETKPLFRILEYE